jgi:hypothetical protein
MKCLLIYTAIVCAQGGFLAAQASEDPCCEMKIVAAADSPARLTVTITNVGPGVVGLVRTRPDLDYGVSVKADTGGEVDRTEDFKRLLREPPGGRAVYEELGTGESSSEELDLGKICELKSGTYKVTLAHDVYVGGVKGGIKVSLESTMELKIP